VAVLTSGCTASRRIRTEDEMNRGEGFARPEDIKGVIPGAVDVADYSSVDFSRTCTYANSIPKMSRARLS
jgi:hypothetical protein